VPSQHARPGARLFGRLGVSANGAGPGLPYRLGTVSLNPLLRPRTSTHIGDSPEAVGTDATPNTSTTINRRPSVRLVTWWCGVFAEGHPPGLEIRVAQEPVDELGRTADAGPVVVPQRRHQP
jgi:hypothetical protein